MPETPSWSTQDQALWARILAHPFEAPGQALDFTRRLAREQGWTLYEARQAVEEYRRFCFLAVREGRPMTPSEQVDAVWHLHLIHSRDYWQQFCPVVLGCALHHGPTQGGQREAQRYRAQYAETLAAYERHFGPPPPRWWPGHAERFADPPRMLRIDRRRYWLLPKPRLPRALAPVAAVLLMPTSARALPLNPLDWTAGPFLALYIVLCALALLLSWHWRRRLRDTGPGQAVPLDVWDTACLVGGAERVVDTAVVDLLQQGAAVLDANGQRLQIAADPQQLSPPLDGVARQLRDDEGELARVISRKQPWVTAAEQRLRQFGLLLSPGESMKAAWLSVLPVLVVLALGLAKLWVGLSRGKPIGFLFVLCFVLLVVALVCAANRPRLSLAGDARLASLKTQHARLQRAPRDAELALAVALGGTAILSGTAFAAYHSARHPPGSASDAGSSEDGEGEGSGGSGCGGCGGGD